MIRKWIHRVRFHLWLLGAADVDGFAWRAYILGRLKRKLLHGPKS